jgi:RNA polymerase sigma-70 factor (ECF subfamily)
MLKKYLLENRESHYRMAYSYTKNQEDALDVLQDSIEKAFRAFKRGSEPEMLNSWFYRILINTAIDFIRKNNRLTYMESEKMEYMLTHEDHYRDFDLETALEKLPHKYRTIVVLRYFEDMKLHEIAKVLDENTNTIKTRLYKSLELLRMDLQEGANESIE